MSLCPMRGNMPNMPGKVRVLEGGVEEGDEGVKGGEGRGGVVGCCTWKFSKVVLH